MRLGQAGKALRRAPKRSLQPCQRCHRRSLASKPALRSADQESSSADGLIRTWAGLFPEAPQWQSRLRDAMEGSRGRQARKFTRIAVLGTHAGQSEAFVSALVQDPLHPDFLVAERWAHRPIGQGSLEEPLLISPDAGSVSNGISTSSPWLANNHCEILEYRPDAVLNPTQTLVAELLSADQVVLAISDSDAPDLCRSMLKELKGHPSLVVTCNTLLSTDITTFKQEVNISPEVAFLPFDSRTAKLAVQTIKNGQDLGRYSQNLTESRVPTIADALIECRPSASSLASSYTLERALARLEGGAVDSQQLALHLQVQQNVAKAAVHESLSELHLLSSQILSPEAREQCRTAFQYALHRRLAWWKLPFGRADDVMAELSQAAQVAWKTPESELLFAAGRLDGVRKDLEVAATQDALTPPTANGHSQHSLAVLDNQVQQLVESGKTRITSESALAPFEGRRRQVIGPAGLAEAAYRSTQTAVLSNYLLLLGTSAASYMSVLSELAQWPTAAAGGLFGAVFASWRLQKAWEKVKRRFMNNLNRLNDGLEEDLKDFVKESSQRATLKLDTLIEGLKEADRQRQGQAIQAASVIERRLQELDEKVQTK